MSIAEELIAAERARQVTEEGYSAHHDDLYRTGILAAAADCYRDAAHRDPERWEDDDAEWATPPPLWPWSADWWKPSDDPIRNLVKAGALYRAEIDRAIRRGSTHRLDGFNDALRAVVEELDLRIGETRVLVPAAGPADALVAEAAEVLREVSSFAARFPADLYDRIERTRRGLELLRQGLQ